MMRNARLAINNAFIYSNVRWRQISILFHCILCMELFQSATGWIIWRKNSFSFFFLSYECLVQLILLIRLAYSIWLINWFGCCIVGLRLITCVLSVSPFSWFARLIDGRLFPLFFFCVHCVLSWEKKRNFVFFFFHSFDSLVTCDEIWLGSCSHLRFVSIVDRNSMDYPRLARFSVAAPCFLLLPLLLRFLRSFLLFARLCGFFVGFSQPRGAEYPRRPLGSSWSLPWTDLERTWSGILPEIATARSRRFLRRQSIFPTSFAMAYRWLHRTGNHTDLLAKIDYPSARHTPARLYSQRFNQSFCPSRPKPSPLLIVDPFVRRWQPLGSFYVSVT